MIKAEGRREGVDKRADERCGKERRWVRGNKEGYRRC